MKDYKRHTIFKQQIFWIVGVILISLTLSYLAQTVHAEDISYSSGDRRDPFMPLIGPDGAVKVGRAKSDLIIEGIIFDPKEGSLVLISNNFYKEGDQVQNANIISIFKDRIVLAENDEEKVLWLREEIVDGIDNKLNA